MPTTEPAAAREALSPQELAIRLKERARELGFDLSGIAPAVAPTTLAQLDAWLARGFAGEMSYVERRRDAYESPSRLLPGAKSVVMLGMNYYTGDPEPPASGEGRIARYAWGTADYHDLIRERLRQLADTLHELYPGCRTRGCVDTAPLLERDYARLAGLGWFGKNTMLIHKRLGSWLFLAALLTDVELPPDAPHNTAHCGTCTRCLDACPTDAFPEPYVLDASRCISYLTIELRGPIPGELQSGVGDWLFGCDICNEVCPWNRKAPHSREPALQPSDHHGALDARTFLSLTPEEFQTRFGHTPLSRPGLDGLRRNAEVVLRNAASAPEAPSNQDARRTGEPL